MAEPVVGANSTCPACGGDGETESGFCYLCLGTGHRISIGMNVFLKQFRDEQMAKWEALEDWCVTVNQKLTYLKNKIDAL